MSYVMQAVKQDFGRAAPAYDHYAELQKNVLVECATLAENYFDTGKPVLDIGAGTGALAAARPQWEPIALDIAFPMCRQAARYPQGVCNADMHHLPIADASIENIFCSLALQWSNAPAQVFVEFARVLRSGGHAAIATFGPETLHELRAAFAAVDPWPHVSEFLPFAMLQHMAQSVGLHIVYAKMQHITQYHLDLYALMHSLKVIGASNKHSARRAGLTPPSVLARASRFYHAHYAAPRGLPATWEVLYLGLAKP